MGIEDQFGRPVSQKRIDAREKQGVNDPKKAEVMAYAAVVDMDAAIRDKKAGFGVSARRKKSLAEDQMKKAGLEYDLPDRPRAQPKKPSSDQLPDNKPLRLRARRKKAELFLSERPHTQINKPLGDQLFQARENLLQARDAYDPGGDLLERAIKSYRLELNAALEKAKNSKDQARVAELQKEIRQLESVRYGTKAVFWEESKRPGRHVRDTGLDAIERKKDPEGIDKMSFGRNDTEDDEADLG